MHWILLFFASAVEICWMYSLKALDFARIRNAPWREAFSQWEPWAALFPLIGYIGFGITNVVLFSQATKVIPMAVAFAVWTGLAMVGAKLIDSLVFHVPTSYKELFFMGLIVAGVIGLRTTHT